MVQRKGPDIHGSRTESKKTHAKTEKHISSSHQHQEDKNKGVDDLKRKLKKARSIKRISELENLGAHLGHQYMQINKSSTRTKPSPVRAASDGSSPNYMKPTTSSDARKEKLQVSLHPPATSDKKRSPRNSSKLNPSKVSPSNGQNKPTKTLTRKSSLKPIRPLMKKSLEIPLFPKINASKATCSSTLKDSKFPKELELIPGATEAEGTSAMKVCPFTYCSLNGHRHEPLPPLKCFMSARRRLLKTQKSMKLKGLSSFRKRGLRKGKKQIGTGEEEPYSVPSVSAISPAIEDTDDDFFIEIYASSHGEIVDTAVDEGNSNAKSVIPDSFRETPSLGDGEKNTESELVKSPVEDCYSEISSEEDLDQESDASISEMDIRMVFLEHEECDNQVRGADFIEGYYRRGSDFCTVDGSGDTIEDLAKNEAKESVSEAVDVDCSEAVPEYPNFGAGDKGDSDLIKGEVHGEYQEDRDENDDRDFSSDISDNGDDMYNSLHLDRVDQASDVAYNPSHDASDQNPVSPEVYDQEGNGDLGKDICSSVLLDPGKDISEETIKASDMKSENILELASGEVDDKDAYSQLADQETEPPTIEAANDMVLINGGVEYSENDNDERKSENDEVEDTIDLQEVQVPDHSLGEATQGTDEEGNIKSGPETDVCFCDEVIEDSHLRYDSSKDQSDTGGLDNNNEKAEQTQFGEPNNVATGRIKSSKEHDDGVNHVMQIEEDLKHDAEENCSSVSSEWSEETDSIASDTTDSDQLLPEAGSKVKARTRITRKRTDENLDELKPFNPRAPNFLPVEPDPEAESVDLRHQMMDERKNAEEWMTDYALQRAVTKLAPAREKKVALLVEAFETVTPLPLYEAPIQHSNSGFPHTRPIQACN